MAAVNRTAVELLSPTTMRGLLPLVILILTVGCGSSSTPSTPSSPAPPVTSPFANLAGTWTGAIESSNFPSHPITLVVSQGLSCVDGEYKDASGDWKGTISGFAAADSFSGQIAFERTAAGGGTCQAAGNISGSVVGDSFRWKAGSLTPSGTCTGDLPQNFLLSVQRQ